MKFQEELAEKLGVSRQAVARWEAGETTPDMKMLLGICEVFSVSAICFAIAAFCGIISIVVSSHPAQLALSCFSSTVLLVLCVIQFRLYFKRKSFDNSIQNARE